MKNVDIHKIVEGFSKIAQQKQSSPYAISAKMESDVLAYIKRIIPSSLVSISGQEANIIIEPRQVGNKVIYLVDTRHLYASLFQILSRGFKMSNDFNSFVIKYLKKIYGPKYDIRPAT